MNFLWTVLTCFSIVFFLFSDPNLLLTSATASIYESLKLCFILSGIYIFWMGIISIVEESGLANKLSKLLMPFILFLFGNVSKEAKELIAVNMSANILGLGNASLPAGLKAMEKLNEERLKNEKLLNKFMQNLKNEKSKNYTTQNCGTKNLFGIFKKFKLNGCHNGIKGKDYIKSESGKSFTKNGKATSKAGQATRAMIMLFAINCCSIQLLPSTVILMRSENGSKASGDVILPIIIVSLICFALTIVLVKLLFKDAFKTKKE